MTELKSRSRNVVLCFDGTSNTFGKTVTNVFRLVEALDHDPERQVIYYDPGVGTLPEPGLLTGAAKRISEVFGLAFGVGLIRKVEEAYQFLTEVWQPGDRLFIFGFSRGAYTARVLAALLHAVGLLPKGNVNLIPYAMNYFKAVRHGTASNPSPYWEYLDKMRETVSRECGTPDKRFPTYFLGLWDTVSSVGWIYNQLYFPYTAKNPSVLHIRHAISIDERRCFFRQNRFDSTGNQDLKEFWFAGSHGDVGGGYDPPGAAWRVAFDWILEESTALDLYIDQNRLEKVLKDSSDHQDHFTDMIHDQLNIQKLWWFAEFIPKLVYIKKSNSRRISFGMGETRKLLSADDKTIADKIHRSALLRIRETDYSPPQFSSNLMNEIRGLTAIPEFLEYHE